MKIVYYLILLLFICATTVVAEEPVPQDEDWLYSVDSSVVLKGHVPKLSIKPSKPFDDKTKSSKKSSADRHDPDDVHNIVDKKRKKRGPEFKETQKGLEYDQFHDYMRADVFEPGGKINKINYDYSSNEKNE